MERADFYLLPLLDISMALDRRAAMASSARSAPPSQAPISTSTDSLMRPVHDMFQRIASRNGPWAGPCCTGDSLDHATRPERVALIRRALHAYADKEQRATLSPIEARVVARYLRSECARLNIGEPDYLRDW